MAGGTGFIGAHVVAAARAQNVPVRAIPGFRVDGDSAVTGTAKPLKEAHRWQAEHAGAFNELCAALDGLDVLIDATGLAQPGGRDRRTLFAANAAHVAVTALAAREAGVRRLVQVSSAVVQGRLDPLDESSHVSPLSPYAASKAAAERFLLDGPPHVPSEVVVYRPTSVLSPRRRPARQLARLAGLPAVPVLGNGSQPVPVSLIENVAAGIVFAATMPSPPAIALQPGEGVTARMLLEFFGAGRIVSLPPGGARLGTQLLSQATGRSPRLTALARQLEVVWCGQGVRSEHLANAGFVPPVGVEGWAELGRSLVRERRERRDPRDGRELPARSGQT